MLVRAFLFILFTIALFFVKAAHAEPSAGAKRDVISSNAICETLSSESGWRQRNANLHPFAH